MCAWQTKSAEVEDASAEFIALYREQWKALYYSAYRILRDKQASEDIVQDVFINIWNKRNELRITTSFSAYMAAAVRYEVYRKVRNDKKFEPIVDGMTDLYFECTVAESLEYKDLLKQVASRVQDLPEKCREVYILSRDENLSHKEISDRLSISTKTVRNHLTRALRQLRPGWVEITLIFLNILFR